MRSRPPQASGPTKLQDTSASGSGLVTSSVGEPPPWEGCAVTALAQSFCQSTYPLAAGYTDLSSLEGGEEAGAETKAGFLTEP